jgi:magnesium chelatase family protein
LNTRTHSGVVLGITGHVVAVEAEVTPGTPGVRVADLADGVLSAAIERVTAAMRNSGRSIPPGASIRVAAPNVAASATQFDLAIATALAAAAGDLAETGRLGGYVLIGELALDGTVRAVRGVLSVAMAARESGFAGIIVPGDNVAEAALVDGLDVRGADTLSAVVSFLMHASELPGAAGAAARRSPPPAGVDFSDVRGQHHAKRALEVAAAGGHSCLLVGPPGAGKTMLAQRLPTILPPLDGPDALVTLQLHSVAGLLGNGIAALGVRPFRNPHPTIPDVGLIGGGSNPRPGEVSLAHNGVLFLDELAEFRRSVLDALHRLVEEGQVHLVRRSQTITYPARFLLVSAMNPCPCGWAGDVSRRCACGPVATQRYLQRVSAPVIERTDIQVEVPAIPRSVIAGMDAGESSDAILERVVRARDIERRRLGPDRTNSLLDPSEVREFCRISEVGDSLVRSAITRLGLTPAAYDRVRKVGRSIADLARTDINTSHLAESIQYVANLSRPHRPPTIDDQ